VRTPLHSCGALAEQIKRLAVSLFIPINIQMTLKRWQESMCIAGFGFVRWIARPAILMLCAAGAFMRVGKKTFNRTLHH
jgi:hypothetical protein